MRLLIIDDDPVHRMVIAKLGQRAGLDIDIAASAAEAGGKLAADDYGAVTLDLKLGDADGIDLLRQIEALPSRPTVLVISSSDEASRQIVLDAGRRGGLRLIDVPKPIDLGVLREHFVILAQA